MAQFLTTHGVASEIERLIVGARERLVMVTPYLKVSQILIERLLDANRAGISISLVYGKVELPHAEMAKLRRVSKLDLRFSEHLHAKCYFNESVMVLTSMNLHEFSEKTNREFGVLLTADEQVYRDAVREVESILANAVAVGVNQAQAAEPSPQRLTGTRREPRDFVVSHVGVEVAGKNPHVVCATSIGRVAFWGRRNMQLLHARPSGSSFRIQCRCRGSGIPSLNHDAWVPEDEILRFVDVNGRLTRDG